MSEYTAPTKFIDLVQQQQKIRENIDFAIKKVLDHGQYIMGPEVKDFESQLCEYTGAKHAVTCANGTDAISIVLMAWGVGKNDAIFVPSFTYVASAESPAQLGATPFFIDVDNDTFNIDPDSFKQAIIDCKNLDLNPSVVILVDLFGQPADIDSIKNIADSEGIKILIDSAQSFGGIRDARTVGSMGDACTTSFFPAKPLGCYGDGGAIFTNNDEDFEIFNSIRLHGKGSQKYDNVRIGFNSRLDTIQAAILIEKLKLFPDEVKQRNKVANLYSAFLSGCVKTPQIESNVISSWAQYTIQSDKRDELQIALKEKNIPSIIYYPIPLHKQIGYKHYPRVSSNLLTSEKLSTSVLSLPMHPYLTEDKIKYITSSIIEILNDKI